MNRKIALNAKTRFSNRVQDYIQYRPHYPPAILAILTEAIGLNPAWVVADIGSGTGILSELFLTSGNTVYGVEPNPGMRAAAETLLGGYATFHSVVGSAEVTGLGKNSIDLVTAGQAFHWFEPAKTKRAFKTILRPRGWVTLIWNSRQDSAPFMQAYEALFHKYVPEYGQVNHTNVDDTVLADFFGGPQAYQMVTLPNSQTFDLAGLQGRALSSSYTPQPGEASHEILMAKLTELFHCHAQNGVIQFEYKTNIFYGQL